MTHPKTCLCHACCKSRKAQTQRKSLHAAIRNTAALMSASGYTVEEANARIRMVMSAGMSLPQSWRTKPSDSEG